MATTLYFFATENDLPLQQAAQAFGAGSGNATTQYRMSSLFTGSLSNNQVMAHAVVASRVLFFVSDSSVDRYNIVLRPLTQIPGFPVIKYFIYRGIVKSDFLDSDNVIVAGNTCRLKTVIAISNNPMKALENYSTQPGTMAVDELFLKQENQFATVNPGDSLGHFDNAAGFDYGFDIVLDEPGYQLTLATARKSDNLLDIAALIDADAKEAARLETLAYLDPAAFYGLCMHAAFEVKNNNAATYKKDKVYTLLKKFVTKNQVYVDIRDRWGLPQGFIGGTTNTVKISQDAGSASSSTAIAYRSANDWPLHLLQSSFASPTSKDGYQYFTLKLSLALDGITHPLLQAQAGYWNSYFTEFREEVKFTKLTVSAGWTSDSAFAVMAVTDGSSTVPAATYLRVQLTDYSSDDALSGQAPEKQPFDNEVFELSGMFAPEWTPAPQFSAVTDARFKTIVRLAPYLTYNLHKGSAIAFTKGVGIDSDGVVAFCLRGRHYIPLQSNQDKDNEGIAKNLLGSTLSLQSGEYPQDGFWKFIEQSSKYDYDYLISYHKDKQTKKFALKYKQRKIPNGVIKPYKITLPTANVNTLELRLRDPIVVRGYDYSPAEPFICLGYSTAERAVISGIMNDTTKFAPVGPKFLVYDATPAPVSEANSRDHYKFTLRIRGLKYSGGQFAWSDEPTTVDFYSVDGERYFTNQYATAAFARIVGTIWDNASIPEAVPSTSNPFLNTDKYSNVLKGQLYAELQTLRALDARLLSGEIRDELYDGNLEGLSFQMAFRAPFFIERPRKTPYTLVTVNNVAVNNNPYKDNFDAWLKSANSLRTLQTTPPLDPLARTGLTKGLTDAIHAEQDHLHIYDVLDIVRNDSFANQHVPAYMARVMEDENAKALYVERPHFPLTAKTKTQTSYTSAQLASLVSAGTIDDSIKNYLTGLAANAFGWKKLLNASDAHGYYIVKKSNSSDFHILHSITFGNANARNSSGITIGMGFDLGKQTLSTYHMYTNGLTIPHATDAEEALGQSRGRALCLKLLFDVDIWDVFLMPYDFAVEHTVPFMRDEYLTAMLNQMHNNVPAAQRLLKVFSQSGSTAFYLPGGIQYFNEVEKAVLLSHTYNAGAGALSVKSALGKKFVHAVNSHDWRWLHLAWKDALVDEGRKHKMQIFLERTETMEHYDYTKTTL